jgi:tetratricopeptide (TPR) repeat protein
MSQVVRWRMLERMEAIRSGNLPRPDLGHVSEKIARDAAMLGEYERALHFVGVALQERGDEGMLLNLRGIYRQNIGDKDGAFEAYRKAAEQWSGARFNLALMHYRAGRCIEALKEVDAAIEDEPERAYCVLRGDILNKLGRNPEARKEWQDAIDGNIDYMALDEFDLGWLDTCAQRIEQGAVRDKIREARERKAQRAVRVARVGELPVYVGQPLRDISDVV